jgi:hypothetical protein
LWRKFSVEYESYTACSAVVVRQLDAIDIRLLDGCVVRYAFCDFVRGDVLALPPVSVANAVDEIQQTLWSVSDHITSSEVRVSFLENIFDNLGIVRFGIVEVSLELLLDIAGI